MPQSIEGAIATLQAKAAAITGMGVAYGAPIEASAVFPFSAAIEADGDLQQATFGWGYNLGTIIVEFHVARQILNLDIVQVYSLRDSFVKALISDSTLGGTVETTTAIRWVGPRAMKWNEEDTVGYRWTIGVKITMIGS